MVWHLDAQLPSGTDLVVVPGGFSYGDYLRCGAIAARAPIMDAVRRFADGGGLVLGVCNGFQILCEAGLLPGVLMRNAALKFICRDVYLKVERSDSAFTRGYNAGQVIRVPIAHGEGNYVADAQTIARLEGEGRVLYRYVAPSGELDPAWNFNGATNAIAGIVSDARQCARHDAASGKSRRSGAGRDRRARVVPGARGSLQAGGLKITVMIGNELQDHPRAGRRARPQAGGVSAPPRPHRPPSDLHRARHLLGHVERALLLQILESPSADPAHRGAVGDPGAGRERRRHRHRRRPGGRVQDGEPQPPELHRALPGRHHRGRRHIARRVHHGGAADRLPRLPVVRRSGASEDPPPRGRRGGGDRRLRQFLRGADGGRLGRFHRRYDGNCLVNAMAVGIADTDKIFYATATGVGKPIVYLGSKTGRDGIHGATMASAEFGADAGKAPDRPGGRSVLRKAAARSVPRDHGQGTASSPSRTWGRPG